MKLSCLVLLLHDCTEDCFDSFLFQICIMKVSIIIPTFNRINSLINSLESWDKQSYSNSDYEVIVVDNNSTDQTEFIVNEFIKDKSNFKYLKEIQPGSTAARHKGVKHSKNDILIFADDDGIYNVHCIFEIVKLFNLNKEIKAVTGKIIIEWDKTPPTWIEPYEFMLAKLDYGDTVKIGVNLYLNGCLFAIYKDLFYSLNGFNPDLIGDYLIGDGDTGLVIKLHQNNILIGYTPYAIMSHMLEVETHANVSDVGRRFYNVGVSDAYGIFRANMFHFNICVLRYVSKSFVFFIKKFIEYRILSKNTRKYFFSFMQRKGELTFFMNLRKREIRRIIKESTYIE
jgi:glucosyl-dolichyl phosphate glucuronosyltransferase